MYFNLPLVWWLINHHKPPLISINILLSVPVCVCVCVRVCKISDRTFNLHVFLSNFGLYPLNSSAELWHRLLVSNVFSLLVQNEKQLTTFTQRPSSSDVTPKSYKRSEFDRSLLCPWSLIDQQMKRGLVGKKSGWILNHTSRWKLHIW